jgi:uncharacterized membrane protein
MPSAAIAFLLTAAVCFGALIAVVPLFLQFMIVIVDEE